MPWVYEHYTKIFTWPGSAYAIYFQREKEISVSRLHQGYQFTTAKWVFTCLWLGDNLPMSGSGAPAGAGALHLTVGVQITQTGNPHDGALMQEPHLNCLRPTCNSRVTCTFQVRFQPLFLYVFVFICLWSLIFTVPHFYPHSRPFEFCMLKMWLTQLPLPSPTWLHSSVICLPARSDMGHTTGRQRDVYFQGTLLPQESAARRHVPLLHLCRLSSFSWLT